MNYFSNTSDINALIPQEFEGRKEISISEDTLKWAEQNEITRQLRVTDVCYFTNRKFLFAEHFDDAKQYVFVYCFKGSCFIELNDYAMHLKVGDCILVPANEEHCFYADFNEHWGIFGIKFNGEYVENFKDIIGHSLTLPEEENRLLLFNLFADIFTTIKDGGDSHKSMEYASCAMIHLLGLLKQSATKNIRTDAKVDTVYKCIKYMRENILNKLTMQELADYADYSVPHLHTLFKREVQTSPMDCYYKLKIQRACTILADNRIKIKDIAGQLGYYDQFHFSKMFLKEMGLSPQHYRNGLRMGTIKR